MKSTGTAEEKDPVPDAISYGIIGKTKVRFQIAPMAYKNLPPRKM